VQLTDATRILTRSGADVDRDWLFAGQPVEVIASPLVWSGLAQRSARAAIVWVAYAPTDPGPGPDPGVPTELSGAITSVDPAASRFDLQTDDGPACVSVVGTTEIDLFTCTSTGCTGRSVGIGQLAIGQQAVAVGTRSSGSCLVADNVVAFENAP